MKHMDNVLGPVRREARRSMRALAATKRFWFDFYTKEYLEDLRKKTIEGSLPGHNMTEYDAWRTPLRLQDTNENRIRYQLYLNDLVRKKTSNKPTDAGEVENH
jgi:hypothetical protein